MRIQFFCIVVMVSLFLMSCTPEPLAPEPTPSVEEGPKEQCADYDRNGVLENHCATCGNNVCEPFESCTPTSCNLEACTKDCGQLHCDQDCVKEEAPILQSGVLPEATLSLKICNKDSDCVKVNADCCGCTAGGKATTLAMKSEKVWQQTLDVKCKDIMCPAVMSQDWSCFVEPKCIKNKCTLIKE
jgi:hypothetical protein